MKYIKEIEITPEEFELLKRCEFKGFLEYRDEYSTFEKFSKKYPGNTLERFNSRNENGTFKLAISLREKGLLNNEEMAWHTTFKLSDDGVKAIIQLNQK